MQGTVGYFESENLDLDLLLPLADCEIWVKPFEPLNLHFLIHLLHRAFRKIK